jgi:hypothetical protein
MERIFDASTFWIPITGFLVELSQLKVAKRSKTMLTNGGLSLLFGFSANVNAGGVCFGVNGRKSKLFGELFRLIVEILPNIHCVDGHGSRGTQPVGS